MRRHIVPALQPLFFDKQQTNDYLPEDLLYKNWHKSPGGKARVSRPGKPNGLPEVPWGQTMPLTRAVPKFLLRNSNRSFNQRKLEQISPNIISRPFIYESMHAHAYIYIIEITIGRFYFVLLDRKLRHCPLCQRRTTVSQWTKHAVGSLRRTLDRSEVHNSLIV